MQIYSVSEFVKAVSDYLEQGLGQVAVQGEITGFNINQGRLVFFELKDDHSRVTCFALTHEINGTLEDGQEVRILGVPKLFKKSGKFHVHVSEVELVGEGALQKAFAKLEARFLSEGLFDEQYKKPLPRFPESIGLITSRDAAAFNDVIVRLNERWGGLFIKHAHVGVQGLGSVSQIVKSIEYINSYEPVDVIILTRGGGSLEDLQSFNDERVVRAVFASKIPIVVGVGHERDVTLAELAADARASTPTNAAELVVSHRREVLYQIETFETQLTGNIEDYVYEQQRFVSELVDRLQRVVDSVFTRFNHLWQRLQFIGSFIFREYQQLSEKTLVLQRNLQLHTSRWLTNYKQKVDNTIKQFNALNPTATLKRGYSITYHNGKVLKNINDVQSGASVHTALLDGTFSSDVKKVNL